MNKYKNYLKFMFDNKDTFLSDSEVASKLKERRRIISSLRVKALTNQDIKGMYVRLSDGVIEIQYLVSKTHYMYKSADIRQTPIDISFMKSISISASNLETIEAIVKLNTDYWDINQLANLLNVSPDKAKRRLRSFATSARKHLHIHNILDDNKQRLYLAVAPKEKYLTTSTDKDTVPNSDKAKAALAQVFGGIF